MALYQGDDYGTGDILSSRIPIEMSPEITYLAGDNAPFTILLQMLDNFKESMTKKFEWHEREDFDNTATLTTAYASGTTAVFGTADGVSQYKKLRIGDILQNPINQEIFRVTTTPSSANVTVSPNWPTGSGATAVASGTKFFIIGNAQGEFSDVRDLIAKQPTAAYNYIQQFRNPFGLSGRLDATATIGVSEMEYLDSDHFRNFMREREMAFLFGQRGVDASDDVTTSGGIKWFMDNGGSGVYQKNMLNESLTLTEWLSFLEDAFWRKSGPEKIMITGRNPAQIINSFAYEKLQVDMEMAEFGLNIQTFRSPTGTLRILRHDLFTELGMDDEAWIIDLPSLTRRGLGDGRSVPHLNRGKNGTGLQGNGVDGEIVEYAVEEGLQLVHPERFARIYNVAPQA